MLNSENKPLTKPPKNAPCFDRSILVKKYQGGWTAISKISRGDWIYDDNKWTKVIGWCEREVYGGIGNKGSRMTDGVWIRQAAGSWEHPTEKPDKWTWRGIQLVTESGTFNIKRVDFEEVYTVRDFTEVGHTNLLESYAREDAVMNK
jgi:hypothetical protein